MSARGEGAPDVGIYEVGPRDGLQNESEFVATSAKLELFSRLVTAGLSRVEVASFVSPRWIPQLADADELAAALPPHHMRRTERWSPMSADTNACARLAASRSPLRSSRRVRHTTRRM